MHKKILNNNGQTIIEIILAMSIFVLMAAAMVTLVLGSNTALEQGDAHTQAEALVQEAFEAVRSIRDGAWNELIYHQSSLVINNNQWVLSGEGTDETIGRYSRKIIFEDVCRDDSDNIVTCPGTHTDIHTKKITVIVEWSVREGLTSTVEQTTYLTNWDSIDWTQTDWSGGAGQSTWSNITRYLSDDGNVDHSTNGELKLASLGGAGCGTNSWPFTTASNYNYDINDIEVANDVAQLVGDGSGIIGIENQVVDNLEYNTILGVDPRMINVSGNVYAIVYESSNNDGFLVTVNIDPSGNIQDTIIDSYEFGPLDGEEPDIIQVAGNIYAIVYEGASNDGFVSTVSIATSGLISKTLIDTLEFDTVDMDQPDIVQLDINSYAVAYNGSSGDGFIRTFNIDSSGNISNSYIDSIEFDTIDTDDPKIIKLSNQIYAIAYNGPSSDGWLKTVSIDNNGNIQNNVIDSYEYDPSSGYNPSIVHVSGDYYAVAYRGPGTDGWVRTLKIDSTSGDITKTSIDSLEFDTTKATNPEIIYMTDNVYAVVYENSSNHGVISIFNISNDGVIDDTVIDTLEFNTSRGLDPFVIKISDNFLAIAYSGPDNDGWLTSVELTSATSYPDSSPDIKPVDSYTVTDIDAWTGFSEIAIKNGVSEIYYQLSNDDGSSWQYWDGATWSTAGANNYNTADIINANISLFATTTGQINFKAFFESDGTDQIKLDEVKVSCEQYNNWPFTTPNNYNYDSTDIEVTHGVAQLVSGMNISGLVDKTIDDYEYDTRYGRFSNILNVSDSVYAVVYQGSGNDGWVKTFEISSEGIVTKHIIDSYEFDRSDGRYPDFMHVAKDTYLVAYSGPGSDGFVRTFSISPAGYINHNIGIGVNNNSLEFDTSYALLPSLIHVVKDVYAVAYQGPDNDGWLKTFTVNASGDISHTYLDKFEYEISNCLAPDIIQINEKIYAIVYTGDSNDGIIKTVSIDESGNITPVVIDKFKYDTSTARYPDIIHLAGDYFAIAYSGSGSDGFIRTFIIDSDGNIGHSYIDSLEFNTSYGMYPSIVRVNHNYYLVAYRGPSNDGFVDLIFIDTIGKIEDDVIDSLEFNTSNATEPDIINLEGLYYAITYAGPGNDGWVTTIEVEESLSYPNDKPTIKPVTVYNGSNINQWASFNETAVKNGTSEIYYQLSNDNTNWYYWNGNSWAHVSSINNYNNASIINNNIKDFSTTTNDIIFKAFLSSNGIDQVQLDNIRIGWGEDDGQGSGYVTYGHLISSAYDMHDSSPVQVIKWDEDLSANSEIKFQIRTAPNSNGNPGVWTEWYGANGANTYFDNASGSLIPADLNSNQWVQYRVELSGDGLDTPILNNIKINYK